MTIQIHVLSNGIAMSRRKIVSLGVVVILESGVVVDAGDPKTVV